MEKSVLLEINRISNLMNLSNLLLEQPGAKKLVVDFLKYLDEIVTKTGDDAAYNKMMDNLNYTDKDFASPEEFELFKNNLRKKLKDLSDRAKKSGDELNVNNLKDKTIIKYKNIVEKLPESKLLQIRNEVWSKYKSHESVDKTISASIDAAFDQLDRTIKLYPDKKIDIESIKVEVKNKILKTGLLKGKEDFIEFCLKNVDDDPRFINKANERIENITGWIHKDPDHVFSIGGTTKDPSAIEKALYTDQSKNIDGLLKKALPRLWELLRNLSAFDNFYMWMKNLTLELQNGGRFSFEQIEMESKQIINTMQEIVINRNKGLINNDAANKMIDALHTRLINRLKAIQAPIPTKDYTPKPITDLYNEIENALLEAKTAKKDGAEDLYKLFHQTKTSNGNTYLGQIEHALEKINEIQGKGDQFLSDVFMPEMKKYNEEIQVYVTRDKTISDQFGSVAENIKSIKEKGKVLAEATKTFITERLPQMAFNNLRYGVFTDIGKMRTFFIRYGYTKGTFFLYCRMVFMKTVIIPILETTAESIIEFLQSNELKLTGTRLTGDLIYLFPSTWKFSNPEERQIALNMIEDEIKQGWGPEFLNKLKENFTFKSLWPIFYPTFESLWRALPYTENKNNDIKEEEGIFSTFWDSEVASVLIDSFKNLFDPTFEFEKAKKISNTLDQWSNKWDEAYKDPFSALGETGVKVKREGIDEKKKNIEEYVNGANNKQLTLPKSEDGSYIIQKYIPLLDYDPKASQNLKTLRINKNSLRNMDTLKKTIEGYGVGFNVYGKFYPLVKGYDNPENVITNNYGPGATEGSKLPWTNWTYIKDPYNNKYYGLDRIQDLIPLKTLEELIKEGSKADMEIQRSDLDNGTKKIIQEVGNYDGLVQSIEINKQQIKEIDPNGECETYFFNNYGKKIGCRYQGTYDALKELIKEKNEEIKKIEKSRKKAYDTMNKLLNTLYNSKIESHNKLASSYVEMFRKNKSLKVDENGYLIYIPYNKKTQQVESYVKYITNKLIKEMEEGKKFGEDNFKHWKDTFKFKKYDEKTGQLKDVKITTKMDEIMDRIDHFRKKYDEDDSFVRAVIDVFGTGIDVIQYTKGLAHLTEGVIVGGLLGVLSTIRESKELVTWTVKHYKDGNWELVKGNFNKKELLNVGKTKRERDERQKESDNPAEGLKKKEQESIMILNRDEKEGLNGLPTKVKQKVKEKLRQGWTTEKPFDFLNTYYTESEINSVFNDKIKIYKLKPSAEFFRTLAKNSSKITVKKGFCKSVKNAKGEYDLSEKEKNTLNHFISKCETKFGV
jgi:hypothetical protein